MLVFHAYINEMHGSRSKIRSKYIVRQRGAEGGHSDFKGLNMFYTDDPKILGATVKVTAPL
jgi:hypothetical protein